MSSIPCTLDQTKRSGRSAGGREGGGRPEGGGGFTRSRRNRSAMPADVRRSDKKFCRLEMVSVRGRKKGRGRVSWALYRRSYLGQKARVRSGRGNGRCRGVGLAWVSAQRKKRAPTGGARASAAEGGRGYPFGFCSEMGRG
jgi:hypothetical protein